MSTAQPFEDAREGEGTGIRRKVPQGVALNLHDDATEGLVTAEAAGVILRAGGSIAAPSAGDGGYREVLSRCGYKEIEAMDTGSSAGDWNGTAVTEGGYSVVWSQRNRYPYYGFSYSVYDGTWEDANG